YPVTYSHAGHGTTLSARYAQTARASFCCTKTIASTTQPSIPALVSRGIITAAAEPEPPQPISGPVPAPRLGLVHWSTRIPYTSDLIFRPDKTLARSEHETTWTSSHPPSPNKPGLTLVHAQIGGWLRGSTTGLRTMYHITTEPTAASPFPQLIFILTPTSKELAKNLSRITLSIAPPDTGGQLLGLQILTPSGDTITYDFTEIQRPAVLNDSEFTPPLRGDSSTQP
ncbi:MAG: hypothetical protein WCI73_08395, partial [Phycisphaerae bacterium]